MNQGPAGGIIVSLRLQVEGVLTDVEHTNPSHCPNGEGWAKGQLDRGRGLSSPRRLRLSRQRVPSCTQPFPCWSYAFPRPGKGPCARKGGSNATSAGDEFYPGCN